MDFERARQIAQEELDRLTPSMGVDLQLCCEKTIEKPKGWVFFYNSREFIRTGSFRERLAGNGPIVVNKSDGKAMSYGSAPTVAEIMANLE